jgi:hypothetical protein
MPEKVPFHDKEASRKWKNQALKALPAWPANRHNEVVPIDAVEVITEAPETILFLRNPQAPAANTRKVRKQRGGFVGLNIPPRRMWGWGLGNGYCGETSFQQALLYFGNYVSQERIRYAADNNELLIGEHDEKAAINLHLLHECFKSQYDEENENGSDGEASNDADDDEEEDDSNEDEEESEEEPGAVTEGMKFLPWILDHLRRGHPVVAGWFLYSEEGLDGYDHIMPIIGATTRTKDEAKPIIASSPNEDDHSTHKADLRSVTGLEFHDLADRYPRYVMHDDTKEGRLLARRSDTKKERQRPETIGDRQLDEEERYLYALPRGHSYGVALRGNMDPEQETCRFVLHVDEWEEPDWGAEDKRNETPKEFTVSGTALGLTAGTQYALLRFDDPATVPKRGKFVDSLTWSRAFVFTATAANVRIDKFDVIKSNGAYFYRLVRHDGPLPVGAASNGGCKWQCVVM